MLNDPTFGHTDPEFGVHVRAALFGAALAATMVSGAAAAAPLDTELVSGYVAPQIPGPGGFRLAGISADARFVAYRYTGPWVPEGATETEYSSEVFLLDRGTGLTEHVSVTLDGRGASAFAGAAISADGRYVAFTSEASLVAADQNGGRTDLGRYDIYVRDRLLGRTELVSVDLGGHAAGGSDHYLSMSSDGRYVSFTSYSQGLVSGDTNGASDIFVRDRALRRTERVSVSSGERQAMTGAFTSSISADGRYVAFDSSDGNLVAGDENRKSDLFVRDRHDGTTRRISLASNGSQANGNSGGEPSISVDGRYVAYCSDATNLVGGDTNGVEDVFVTDTVTGTTQRASVNSAGVAANMEACGPLLSAPLLSADGSFVGFTSRATNLVAEKWDANTADVYLHQRAGESPPEAYDFNLRPLTLEFGEAPLGSAVTRGFSPTNTGHAPLPIATVELLGPDRAQYAFRNYCGATLASGRWCWVAITFAPTRGGATRANLHVIAGDEERHRALRGTGVP